MGAKFAFVGMMSVFEDQCSIRGTLLATFSPNLLPMLGKASYAQPSTEGRGQIHSRCTWRPTEQPHYLYSSYFRTAATYVAYLDELTSPASCTKIFPMDT